MRSTNEPLKRTLNFLEKKLSDEEEEFRRFVEIRENELQRLRTFVSGLRNELSGLLHETDIGEAAADASTSTSQQIRENARRILEAAGGTMPVVELIEALVAQKPPSRDGRQLVRRAIQRDKSFQRDEWGYIHLRW